jgi:nucleoporin NUP2
LSPSKNLAQMEGVGEENEETVYEQRCKAFVFDSDKGEQKVVGLGQLKVKRERQEDGEGQKKRRLLMRVDGGGGLLIVSLGCVISYLQVEGR